MTPSLLLATHSSPGPLLLWCAIGICAGLYLFFNGFRLLKQRNLILNTPVSKVRSAPMGRVELSGLASGPYTLPAPVTARPCYFYRTLVWEWKQSGKNKQWVRVAAECMHVPFFLDDNTGKVLVDPRGAELDLHRDFQEEFCDSFFTTKEEVPPNVHALLSRHGVMTTNKIKVEEFCIKPKNALFVLGTLADNPGLTLSPQPIADEEHHSLVMSGGWANSLLSNPTLSNATSSNPTLSNPTLSNPMPTVSSGTSAAAAAGAGGALGNEGRSVSEHMMGSFKHGRSMFENAGVDKAILEEEFRHASAARVIQLSPAETPVRIAEMTQQQKLAAALNKAGISNPAAWAAAGLAGSASTFSAPTSSAQTGSSGASVSPEGFDLHPAVAIMKGKNDPAFLISWRSQREVVSRLGWKCAAMIWGGPSLALLGLYGLLTLTHLF